MFWQRLLSLFRNGNEADNTGVRLTVEKLEDRMTPSVAADQTFVAAVYRGLLGRAVDPAGLSYWTAQLNGGAGAVQVVRGIESSGEFLSREVQLFYTADLGRNVDTAGLNYYGQALLTGSSVNQVKASLLGSAEFFADSGGTMNGWVAALYRNVLGRAPDAAGLAYYGNTPNDVADRTTAALNILDSAEAQTVKVRSMFQQILDRAPDAGGLAYWTNQLSTGASDAAVVAGIAGSSESYSRLAAAASATAATTPDTAASQYLTAQHLYNGFLPGAEPLAGNVATNAALVVQPPTPPTNLAGTGSNGGTAIAALQGTANQTSAVLGTAGSYIYNGGSIYPSFFGGTNNPSGALGSPSSFYGESYTAPNANNTGQSSNTTAADATSAENSESTTSGSSDSQLG